MCVSARDVTLRSRKPPPSSVLLVVFWSLLIALCFYIIVLIAFMLCSVAPAPSQQGERRDGTLFFLRRHKGEERPRRRDRQPVQEQPALAWQKSRRCEP